MSEHIERRIRSSLRWSWALGVLMLGAMALVTFVSVAALTGDFARVGSARWEGIAIGVGGLAVVAFGAWMLTVVEFGMAADRMQLRQELTRPASHVA